MSWFSGLLKMQSASLVRIPERPSTSGSRTRAPGGDPGLISELKVDHREVQMLMVELGEGLEARQYAGLPHRLRALKTRLEAHVLTENYRFYAQLEDRMAEAPENARLMRDLRREMGTLSREVLHFIDEWQQRGIDEHSAELFGQRLQHVTTLLNQRIDREEQSLFPIYEKLTGHREKDRFRA